MNKIPNFEIVTTVNSHFVTHGSSIHISRLALHWKKYENRKDCIFLIDRSELRVINNRKNQTTCWKFRNLVFFVDKPQQKELFSFHLLLFLFRKEITKQDKHNSVAAMVKAIGIKTVNNNFNILNVWRTHIHTYNPIHSNHRHVIWCGFSVCELATHSLNVLVNYLWHAALQTQIYALFWCFTGFAQTMQQKPQQQCQ